MQLPTTSADAQLQRRTMHESTQDPTASQSWCISLRCALKNGIDRSPTAPSRRSQLGIKHRPPSQPVVISLHCIAIEKNTAADCVPWPTLRTLQQVCKH